MQITILQALCLVASSALVLAFSPTPPPFASLSLRSAASLSLCCSRPGTCKSMVACRMSGDEDDVAPFHKRRQFLNAALALSTTAACSLLPSAALAKKKKEEAVAKPEGPTVTLADFYKALYAQEVESVEFDGPTFERAYVKFSGGANKGKVLLIGEGYEKESPVNSGGPQQVLAKIRNEIKAGNPVVWSWKGAASFKKKPQNAAEKGPDGATPAAGAPEGAAGPAGKGGEAAAGEGEKKGGGGAFFGISLPAPPKSL